jgi:5-methylcytosine-specific restriction endonuclease McrA
LYVRRETKKTNSGMPPQSRTLELSSADTLARKHETGRRSRKAPGVQHGREERIREDAVTSGASRLRRARTGVQRVFVLDRRGNPLMPCHPQRARELLARKRAVVVRAIPFIIRLKDRVGGDVQPVRLGVDPGSKTTGMAVSREKNGVRFVAFKLEIEHRSAVIHKKMGQRANYRRRRRSQNLRYRAPRFNNRKRPGRRLAPSLYSRVAHVENWTRRLHHWCPVSVIDLESVRFDFQRMEDPEISGVEYQRGTLYGYEVREYLLIKFNHQCVYCDARNVPLNIDHVFPRARGGTHRLTNLAMACIPCNQTKKDRLVTDFCPSRAANILKWAAKKSLKDAAAVNSIRTAILNILKKVGFSVVCSSGGRTKRNRHVYGIPKAHALDATCVGMTRGVRTWAGPTLQAKAMGHGRYQRTTPNKYGFPKRNKTTGLIVTFPKKKRPLGFLTGDIVRATVTKGVKTGHHFGRVTIRTNGIFAVGKTEGINYKYCRLVQRSDGYAYATTQGRSSSEKMDLEALTPDPSPTDV